MSSRLRVPATSPVPVLLSGAHRELRRTRRFANPGSLHTASVSEGEVHGVGAPSSSQSDGDILILSLTKYADLP